MRQRAKKVTLAAADTVTTAETTIGTIEVGKIDVLTLFLVYVKGDETSIAVTLYFLDKDGNEHRDGVWSSGSGAKTYSENSYTLADTENRPIVFDVGGWSEVVVKQQATLGTPDGTLAVHYLAARK